MLHEQWYNNKMSEDALNNRVHFAYAFIAWSCLDVHIDLGRQFGGHPPGCPNGQTWRLLIGSLVSGITLRLHRGGE